ncbi:surfactin family lipopeptide synthetase A, partial [Pedobacter terrae]
MTNYQLNLHPSQENIFYDQVIDPENSYYNICGYVILQGKLDITLFESIIESLPEYFDIYHLRFDPGVNPAPQYLEKSKNICSLRKVDFSKYDFPLIAAKEFMQSKADEAFDLEGELFENYMLRIDQDKYYFFFKYHHLLMDGVSVKIWTRHIFLEYEKLRLSSIKPIQSNSYRSYIKEIEESTQYYNSAIYQENKAYWLNKFRNIVIEPILSPRYEIYQSNSLKCGTFSRLINDQLKQDIKQLSDLTGCSLQQLTIAALAIYYNQLNGFENCIFGVSAFNRKKNQKDTVGTFANILPILVKIDQDLPIRNFLKDLRTQQLGSYRHTSYPLRRLNSELRSRSGEAPSLFQITVDYRMLEFDLPFNESKAEIQEICSSRSNLPLQFKWQEFGEQQPLLLKLDYQLGYFTAEEAELLTERILHIMLQLRQLDSLISQLSIIPPVEYGRLVQLQDINPRSFNPPMSDLGNSFPIDVVFSNIAASHRDLPAVKHNGEVKTYRELDEDSNSLARLLSQKPTRFTGVYLSRSETVVTALLGILKAASTYVPLDTQNPPRRILDCLIDNKIETVITSSELLIGLLPMLDSHTAKRIICVDFLTAEEKSKLSLLNIDYSDAADILNSDSSSFSNKKDISSWAYMLFTSGSTGKPKGAITTHAGAMNHILSEIELLKLGEGFRFLQSASIASDISVWQMLAPLCHGGTVIIIDKEELLDYDALYALLRKEEVTIVEFVPSYLTGLCNHFMAAPEKPTLLHLEWIMMVGEEVPVTLVNQWLSLFPACQVLNGYGPCEASDDITQYAIQTLLPEGFGKVPIGRPIHNMNIFLLNKSQQLVPIGEPGEICVSGIGVGPGYWLMPEKTAESFIKNPFENTLGEILYKTGDLARWRSDGQLEFLGREDDQLKIRGFRVELGEIESILNLHPLVAESTVAVKLNEAGVKQLIAYVILKKPMNDDFFSTKRILSHHIAEYLPSHMIPTDHVFLDSFPYNLSDKIDKNRLPSPETGTQKQGEHAPPTDKTQELLCQIWQELLGISQIGIYDNFFELGGDSIITIQVVSRARRAGIEIQPRDVFQHQT